MGHHSNGELYQDMIARFREQQEILREIQVRDDKFMDSIRKDFSKEDNQFLKDCGIKRL
jgi:phosphoenolpyruvate-protein kinase (PTS system EI component)